MGSISRVEFQFTKEYILNILPNIEGLENLTECQVRIQELEQIRICFEKANKDLKETIFEKESQIKTLRKSQEMLIKKLEGKG